MSAPPGGSGHEAILNASKTEGIGDGELGSHPASLLDAAQQRWIAAAGSVPWAGLVTTRHLVPASP